MWHKLHAGLIAEYILKSYAVSMLKVGMPFWIPATEIRDL